jgi:hypothetical protein
MGSLLKRRSAAESVVKRVKNVASFAIALTSMRDAVCRAAQKRRPPAIV